MRLPILILLVVVAANALCAQPPGTTSPRSKALGPAEGSRPTNPAIMATLIRDSYYHPDEMSSFNCAVSFDWPAFFTAIKLNLPAERLKALHDLNVRLQSVRGKSPDITFKWTNGDSANLANQDQFEDGVKQMLGGFDQMYWSLIASPPIGSAAEITRIESLPDGGAKVYSSSQNTNLVINVDKENIPTHYTLGSPALNGTIDSHYVPAPKPVHGDLRRISSMDVSEQIGTSIINVTLNLDYQAVDTFYVPKHVSYNVGGAFSLSMEFSSCSVSKVARDDKIK